ncbi:MAG: histidine--tRNA ligase [Opitutales bacterium]
MFDRLPGFRDLYPEDCARRNMLFRAWAHAARRYGFLEYTPPTLEPLELFTEKSGPEIVSQLFNFTDKGGRTVSLRPELTPSLARMVGARANSLKRPIKWFNLGENFRYEKQQKGRLRCFYQFNADILGEAGAGADAELIGLCVESLVALGLTAKDFVVRLSDRDLWIAYLAALGHEGEQALGILGVIDKRERLGEEAVRAQLAPYFGDATEDFLAQVEALTALDSLAAVRAYLPAQAPTAETRARLEARLGEWQRLFDALEAFGLADYLRLDLGIVRGLAYYTGFVFEVFELEDGRTTGRALAGGGRYDHLVEKLGYTALPACGFAIGDVTVSDLLDKKGLFPSVMTGPDVFVVLGAGEAEAKAAWTAVAALRRSGLAVDYPLKATGFGKQFKAASQSGARLAVIFGEAEVARAAAKVKDLASGGETEVPAAHLVAAVQSMLEDGLPA